MCFSYQGPKTPIEIREKYAKRGSGPALWASDLVWKDLNSL